MTEKIVTSKAKWVLQELIPLILVLGVGLLAVFLGATEAFTFEGAAIIGVASFGLLIYLVFENIKRKRRSTLFAELGNDPDYSLSIWMRKPNKEKWKGKIDTGKNKAKLLEMRHVSIENFMGTTVLVLRGESKTNKTLYIPSRILEDEDDVRLYLVDAVEKLDSKLKYAKPQDREVFTAMLLGKNVTNVAQESKREISQPSEEWKKNKRNAVNTDYSALSSEKTEDETTKVPTENTPFNTKAPVVATQVVGYDAYRKKSASELIDEALTNADKKITEAATKETEEWNESFDKNRITDISSLNDENQVEPKN